MEKKIIIIIALLVFSFIIVFVLQDKSSYYEEFATKVVLLYKGEHDTKGIKKKDREAYENFYKKLTHEDEIIDITRYQDGTKVGTDIYPKAISHDNKCFIKYSDLKLFGVVEEGHNEAIQKLDCKGNLITLYEDYFMPPYEYLIKNPKHDYVLDSMEKSLSGYTFTFLSSYDNSSLILELVLQGNTIIEIEAEYH